jgi:hypothetical protein
MERPHTQGRDRTAGRQVASWANRAAEAGRYQDALSWLRALHVVDGSLPDELAVLHHDCTRHVRDRAAAHRARRGEAAPLTLWLA